MKVRGKVLYHLHQKNFHSKEWKVGRMIQTSQSKNRFRELRNLDFERITEDYKNGNPYIANVISKLRAAKSSVIAQPFISDAALESSRRTANDLLNLSKELQDCLVVYIRFLNEIIFESVREQKFNDHPSRTRCYWLSDKQNLKTWMHMFTAASESELKDYKVFRVKATGNLHKTDGAWLTPDIHTVDEMFERAEKYWKGEPYQGTRLKFPEYVFEGELQILEGWKGQDFNWEKLRSQF